MEDKNKDNKDELRQKVDGFSLDNKAKDMKKEGYKTTGFATFYPSEYFINDEGEVKNLNK